MKSRTQKRIALTLGILALLNTLSASLGLCITSASSKYHFGGITPMLAAVALALFLRARSKEQHEMYERVYTAGLAARQDKEA